jgi:integrase
MQSPVLQRTPGKLPAVETCLSEVDLLRLSERMVDEKAGVIVPGSGRIKTGVRHIAPLRDRARTILEEIRAERRSGAAVPSISELLFSSQGGQPITKGQIES